MHRALAPDGGGTRAPTRARRYTPAVRHALPKIPEAIVTLPTTFAVGKHELVVAKVREGRWTVAVDGRALPASFETQAGAWEAGVREAYQADVRPAQ